MYKAAHLAAAALLLATTTARAQSPVADTIITNGKVITLDAKSTVAQALAIRDGRILAIGSTEDIASAVVPIQVGSGTPSSTCTPD